MLRSKSKAGLGSEGLLKDETRAGGDNKENREEDTNSDVPASPGGLSMRHKIKQSFTNLASLLTPREAKSILRKPSPFAPASKTDAEAAATVPLPETPRSGTPPSNTDSPSAKSPSKSRRYLSFSLNQESKYKMDSKTSKFLLSTARRSGEDAQKSDLSGKGKGKDKASTHANDVEAKSPASIKKEVAGQATGTSLPSPTGATLPASQAASTNDAAKENQRAIATTSTALVVVPQVADKGKGKAEKQAGPKTTTTISNPTVAPIDRPPTPIPRPVRALPAPEPQGGSDLTNQITALLGRLSAGETINYQLRNPVGYVDDDPDCLDFLNDTECQEILGNTAPEAPSASSRRGGKKGRK
ncbi:hypothetical protein TWF481_000953 [Arthrobotrys musiformis]|uniref:Uncharacterized protein n=1 Tax=Arthrobotrys musiformis TaxID=47236 RepID=A0AAV9WP41_9PEZI